MREITHDVITVLSLGGVLSFVSTGFITTGGQVPLLPFAVWVFGTVTTILASVDLSEKLASALAVVGGPISLLAAIWAYESTEYWLMGACLFAFVSVLMWAYQPRKSSLLKVESKIIAPIGILLSSAGAVLVFALI